MPESTSFIDTLHEMSSDSDAIMMGFPLSREGRELPDHWHGRATALLQGLSTTLRVRYSGDAHLFA